MMLTISLLNTEIYDTFERQWELFWISFTPLGCPFFIRFVWLLSVTSWLLRLLKRTKKGWLALLNNNPIFLVLLRVMVKCKLVCILNVRFVIYFFLRKYIFILNLRLSLKMKRNTFWLAQFSHPSQSSLKLTKVLSKKLSPKVTSAALSKIVFLNWKRNKTESHFRTKW